MKGNRATVLATVGLAVMVFCVSCFTPRPSISALLENPREFEGKSVIIQGTVKDRMSLLAVKVFILKDDTGEINVVTKRVLPAPGTTVKVKGHIKEAFAIGKEQLLVFVEE